MTDKPFDHEEYSRERLRQTTPGDYPVDYAAGMLSDLGVEIQAKPQTTPGAGEGERWRVVQSGGGRWKTFVRWLVREGDKTIATCADEVDADLICTLHSERTHLVSRDAYVEMRDARETDQQTIAELRKALEAAKGTLSAYLLFVNQDEIPTPEQCREMTEEVADALAAIAATEGET
jgi:hypothetical protein